MLRFSRIWRRRRFRRWRNEAAEIAKRNCRWEVADRIATSQNQEDILLIKQCYHLAPAVEWAIRVAVCTLRGETREARNALEWARLTDGKPAPTTDPMYW